jgi:hypothetical protein
MEGMRNACKIFIRTPEKNASLTRYRHRVEDNIKMGLK